MMDASTHFFHLAIAADWQYDHDFIHLVERAAHERGISTYVIWPENLLETIHRFENGAINFGFLIDRASDTSLEFLSLQNLFIRQNIPVFDAWEKLTRAADKAAMHTAFQNAGIPTPFTIITPPHQTEETVALTEEEMSRLDAPFVVKPSKTSGGGIGVEKAAKSHSDINQVRRTFPHENYLVQEKIIPLERDGHRFYFRGFYTCGLAQIVWWNDLTHVFRELTGAEMEAYGLFPIYKIVRQIRKICRLNFFSTEIAFDVRGRFVAIDYVNEICDMRLKSRHFDGVPNEIAERIAERIVAFIHYRIFSSSAA